MNLVELTLSNSSSAAFDLITLAPDTGIAATRIRGCDDEIKNLGVNDETDVALSIDFGGKLEPAPLLLTLNKHNKIKVQLSPICGELVRAHLISHIEFEKLKAKLSGMQEQTATVAVNEWAVLPQRVVNAVNAAALARHNDTTFRFSSKNLASDAPVLIQLQLKEKNETGGGSVSLVVNTDDFMFGGNLLEHVKKSIARC